MPDNGPNNETDLERELRDLGSHLEYPPTPGLARAARQRIEEQDEERAARRGRFWLPALSPRWAVAAIFVVVLAVPALSPAARESLSGLLVAGGASSGGGGGAAQSGGGAAQSGGDAGDSVAGKAEPRDMAAGEPEAEQAPAGAEAMPESASGGQAASAGQMGCLDCADNAETDEKITLREARIRTGEGRPVLLPEWPYGRPDAVYEVRPHYGTGIALVYRTRPRLPSIGPTGTGMVLTEIPGGLESTYLQAVPEKKTFEEVNVGGRRGYWSPQWPVYWVPGLRRGPSSMPSPTESVLLWEQEGLSLRLESNLAREEAIRIAESVR